MTDRDPPKPHRRRRRSVAALALTLVALLLGGGLWLASARLSPEEQRLVGAWRHDRPGYGGAAARYDFRPDRALRVRVVSSGTGAVLLDEEMGTWRLAGDRLRVRSLFNPLPPRLGGAGRLYLFWMDERIEWDGPDGFVLSTEGSPNTRGGAYGRLP